MAVATSGFTWSVLRVGRLAVLSSALACAAPAWAGPGQSGEPPAKAALQAAAPENQSGGWRTGDAVRNTPPPAPPVLRAAECVGVDLVRALQENDAASFAKFEDSAREVANGQGLLWRVEGEGGKPSYLFGTMHSSEPIAKSFDELVLRALRRARVVATELPGASTRQVASELRRLIANRSYRVEGDSLDELPAGVRDRVEARLARIGIPPQVAEQLEPWYLALSMSRSQCASGQAGVDTETADALIERFAVEQGAALVALESPVEQVDALASVSDAVALRMMREATERDLRPEDVESTITGLYSTRRIGYLLAMRGPLWAGVFDVDGYADFLNAFIIRRNASMLQRALPILKAGEAFIAVGALHLPGEGGLIELIRKSGYSVTRIW
jgi:uncharacterized protein